jgi:hypothetical protein
LFKYNPFVFFDPLQAITLNRSLHNGGANRIISVPTKLESTSFAFSFSASTQGEQIENFDDDDDFLVENESMRNSNSNNNVDFQINKVMPSQGFDLLSSDFNFQLLFSILFALAVVVNVMRKMHLKSQLSSLWK